jgi:hypothetical protein
MLKDNTNNKNDAQQIANFARGSEERIELDVGMRTLTYVSLSPSTWQALQNTH